MTDRPIHNRPIRDPNKSIPTNLLLRKASRANHTMDRKRLKTTPCQREIGINDLPAEQLVQVSEYLGKTSSVLFAVALTAPAMSWKASNWERGPNKVSRAIIEAAARRSIPPKSVPRAPTNPCFIIHSENSLLKEYYESSNWELLDFSDIRDVATQLNDDDIRAILVCIEAKRRLKRLRLPACQSLRGHGLEELCGSSVLEHVDLSQIVRPAFQLRHDDTSRALCTKDVVRVLLDIINTNDHSLREVILPCDWRTTERISEPLKGFLGVFDEMIKEEEVQCEHCERMCRSQGASRSCQVCFKRICEDCHVAAADEGETFAISCDDCGLMLCQSCGDHRACEKCDVSFCDLCVDRESDHDVVKWCESDSCNEGPMCMKCRKSDMDGVECWACRDMVYPSAIEEKNVAIAEKISAAEENERLVEEIAERDSAIDRLVEENMQLRKRIAEQQGGG